MTQPAPARAPETETPPPGRAGAASRSQTSPCWRAALPRPEIPLLSAAEQHGVQRGERAQPAHVERSDPGAVELKGKARALPSGTSPGPPRTRAECSDVQRNAVGRGPRSCAPRQRSGRVGVTKAFERQGRCWTLVLSGVAAGPPDRHVAGFVKDKGWDQRASLS